jgi:TolB-like protein/DNA-binding winged helix-turn-helix (wHTH) protein/Flp pilus assembly protein TadD
LRLRFEEWVYDAETRQVLRDGAAVRLTPKAFELLGALLENRPRALAKAEIRDRLWPDTVVTEATLASVVSELRACLGDDPKEPRFVRTVHGHGYAFSGTAVEDRATAEVGRQPRRRWLALAGLAVALAMAALLSRAGREAPRPSGPRTLAVLPLEDLSNDPDHAYVVDGLTEVLVTRLAESGLTVVSRASALRYRRSTRPRAEVAKELGADWLMEGSVGREGSSLRLTVRLLDPPAIDAVWTRSYESTLAEASQLPARVARDVAEASSVVLTPERRARLTSVRPVDPEAYDAYLRGRYLLARGSIESNREAIERLQEALAKDPLFAPAYAHLSNAYSLLASVWVGQAPRPMRGLAAAAAAKALELDPDLADAHTYLGLLKLYEWDFEGSEREFLRAIELDPSAGHAHSNYATHLSARGRHDQALAEARKGEALDPLSVRTRRNVGYVLFQARRYDEAIASLQGVVVAEPKDSFSRWVLGWAYSRAGRHPEAIAELEQAIALSDHSPSMVGALAGVLAEAGRQKDSRQLLAELQQTSRERYVSPAAFVFACAPLGERDQVFHWLERGFDERINLMVFVNNLESLDPYRDDPRFRDLVKRIGP